MIHRCTLLLSLLLVSFALVQIASAASQDITGRDSGKISFIQISDIHIGGGGNGREKPNAEANLRSAVKRINEMALQRPDIRFVIASGDLTHTYVLCGI